MYVELKNINKTYGSYQASRNVNFGIEKGKLIGLLGPSGSGKTTILRMIAGLETPDSGEVIIDGKVVNDVPSSQRGIGFVFQNYALFRYMTVYDNVAFGLKVQKADKKKIDARVRELIKLVGLEGLEKRYPSQLSGGQRQRVAFARALAPNPQVLLLDEPFSALDGYLKDVLQREMQDFLQDYPGDMILVTHSRDEAYKFCKELSVVDGGRILVTDETKRLFENPRMLEAAKLTGCKNFSAVQRLGEHEIYATDWKIKLHTAEKVAEDITHVGIRGHWIRPEDKPGENCLEVQVDEYIETTFEHQYMIRRKGEEAAAGLWWMRPKNSFREDPDRGLPKYLYLPPEHLMLLK